MSDLIDRQTVIEVIDAVFPVDPMKSEYAQGIACGAALAKTYVEQLPSAQPEPLTVNFAREMDRETIERLKDGMKNAPVLIMAVNDSVQPDRKPSEWLHDLLQDAIDDGIITEVQAVRIMERVNK